MILEMERDALLRVLGHVTSVVERRTTIPILSNVLLKASGSSLYCKATDLEREVSDAARAQVSQPGAVTISAHILYDIVRKLAEGSEVAIAREVDKERLTVRAGHSIFTLQTLAADDFPDLAAGEFSHTFKMPAKDLQRLIDKTRFAISTEETRYYLNGIYLHLAARGKQATLRAVATDGHRLAQAELPSPKGSEGMPGIILPRKTVNELHRLIEASDDMLTIGVSHARVRFEIGSVIMTSKLIDGSFPDYARVIPKGNDKRLTVSNAEFIHAVDRVSTISSERGRAVKLSIAGDKLVLSVNNPEGGSATEEISVEYDAPPIEIGFNARYLLDIAGQLESDTAQFQLADPGSPTMVRDGSDDGALYVLMPMRV